MVKVIDGKTQRFFSDHKPYKLESFNRAGRNEILLKPEILSNLLAELFRLPEDSISTALSWLENPLDKLCDQTLTVHMALEESA